MLKSSRKVDTYATHCSLFVIVWSLGKWSDVKTLLQRLLLLTCLFSFSEVGHEVLNIVCTSFLNDSFSLLQYIRTTNIISLCLWKCANVQDVTDWIKHLFCKINACTRKYWWNGHIYWRTLLKNNFEVFAGAFLMNLPQRDRWSPISLCYPLCFLF